MISSITRSLAFLVLLTLVSACGARSPATTYYVLDSGQSTPVAALDRAEAEGKPSLSRLQLRRVDMPSYLDRSAVVTREADGVRLNLADFHSWGEPMGNGAQRLLGEVLTPLLLEKNLLLQPVDDDVRGPLQIFVQVQRLDGPLNGEVVLDARWTLRSSEDTTVARGAFVDKEAAGGSYATLVQAQSSLLKRLGQSMAEGIIKSMGNML